MVSKHTIRSCRFPARCHPREGPARGVSGGTSYPDPDLAGAGLKGPGKVQGFTLSFGIAP